MLISYVQLDPANGWKYVVSLTEAKREFNTRYNVLRVVKFFWEEQLPQVTRQDLLAVLETYLKQSDIADLVIDDLRKWKEWRFTKSILTLEQDPMFEIPIVKRSIIRYMLSVPDDAAAKNFVAKQRQLNPERVKDIEEILSLERDKK